MRKKVIVLIESSANKEIKEIKSLSQKKYRDQKGLFIAEGIRFVLEAPDDVLLEKILISESFSKNEETAILKKKAPCTVITDKLFLSISDTKNPQGILMICKKIEYKANEVVKPGGLYIIAEELNNPGNLGTIIRTAHAAGIDGIFLTKGSVDLYNPKVLRSTMGSVFKIPVVQNVDINEITDLMKINGIKIYAAHLKGKNNYYDIDCKAGSAFLVGNEARGLSKEATDMADELITIPMPGGAESLNVSVATSILIYETLRQRLKV